MKNSLPSGLAVWLFVLAPPPETSKVRHSSSFILLAATVDSPRQTTNARIDLVSTQLLSAPGLCTTPQHHQGEHQARPQVQPSIVPGLQPWDRACLTTRDAGLVKLQFEPT